MKPATTVCWLISWLAASCFAAPVHLTQAQLLETEGPPAALQERVDSRALPGQWNEVPLPYGFERRLIPASDAPRMVTHWFRVQVPASALDTAGDSTHLYLKRWVSAGQIAVYADGRMLYRSLGSPMWNQYDHRGLLLPLTHTAGTPVPREILIRIDRPQGTGGGLSSFQVGSTDTLLSQRTVREWLEYQLPFISTTASLVLALFCLTVWLWRRKEPIYLLLFGFAVLQMLRRWHFHTELQRLPVSDAWFGWITLAALSWQIVIVHLFLQLLHGRRMPRLTAVLVVMAALMTLGTLPLGPPLPDLVLVRPALQVLQLAMVIAATGAGLWHSVRSRSLDGMLLGTAAAVAVGFGIYDWLKLQNSVDLEWFYLTPYSSTLYLAAFMFIALRSYMRAVGEVEQLNAGLAQRLQAREAELAQSYEKLRAVEHRQMLSEERHRIMQDMHDGLGSSLTSAIRSVEHGTMSDAEVSQLLKDCMDDLKLAIDSMEPVEADLLLLLATLRFRLEPRIESAGVALHWEVRDVPRLEWLDPSSALHILRIVQEAVANILRHTRATEIHVSTGPAEGGVQVTVEDNGQGFDVAKAHAESAGRGLRNQVRRAQAIHGRAEWQSGPSGTRFTLWLPLETAPEEPAP